jgi:hypothetical protein
MGYLPQAQNMPPLGMEYYAEEWRTIQSVSGSGFESGNQGSERFYLCCEQSEELI